MIKAVIFDLDNTLVDFIHMKNQAIDSAINGMIDSGLKINKKTAKNQIFDIYEKKGYEYQEVLNQFIISVNGSIDYKILAAGIVCYRTAKERSLRTYPKVESTLNDIAGLGLKLGLITDAPSREAWTRLYSVKIHNSFDKVITSDDTNTFKPNPEAFNLMLKYFNISPKEAVMVGDWPERDLDGAKSVGIKTAFAKYGASNINEKQSYNSDVILNSIDEILRYIKLENST
tara:strand:- start:3730 stop:4419 length:690 start_codon:yes stop_codon:yes gene_type:complete